MVIYTRLLFWADGFTLCPGLIAIHPRARADKALLAHEQVHVEQMRQEGLIAWWWAYLTSPAFRQAAEVEAYRAQLALSPYSLDTFAGYLANNYFLGITEAHARELLSAPTTAPQQKAPAA